MDIWVARRIARPRRREAGLRGARPVAAVADRAVGHVAAGTRSSALCQAAEDAAYRDADVVVSMLPKVHDAHGRARAGPAQAAHRAQRHRARRLAAARRSRCATTWPRRWPRRARPGRMVVGYAGSMGLPNALDALLDAAALLRGEALQLRAGRRRPRARAAGARASPTKGWHNVTLLPPMPKAQIPSLLARDRHRLHRLAAGADLPLRHRAEQADGLHDGRLRRCCIRSRPATTRWPRPAAA